MVTRLPRTKPLGLFERKPTSRVYDSIVEVLRVPEIMYICIRILMVSAIALSWPITCYAEKPRENSLEAANQAFEGRDYELALELYSALLKTDLDAATEAKAIFNMGLTHKALGQFDQAIRVFGKVFTSNADDREPGGNLMEAYRNYRPRAQWEIGNCLFAQKKYAEALGAYRRTEEKHAFQSWCGNCMAEFEYSYAFRQGLCHDWLGDSRSAIRLYYKAISTELVLDSSAVSHLRIVNLYEAAGQIKDLEQLLDSIDTDHLAKVRQQLHGTTQLTDKQIMKSSPTQTMRRILAVRRMENDRNWDGLISLLKNKDTVAGPDEAHARQENWEATEAARLLAKHANKTVPLLIAQLTEAESQDNWLYYALGRCGTDEAVAALKIRALKETNCWCTNAVVYALSLAGKRGDVALEKIATEAKGNLKGSITQYRQGMIGDREEDVIFPELHVGPVLPRTLEELRVAQQ